MLCTSLGTGKKGPTKEKSALSDYKALSVLQAVQTGKERKRTRNRPKQMELIQGTREPFCVCEKTPHTHYFVFSEIQDVLLMINRKGAIRE